MVVDVMGQRVAPSANRVRLVSGTTSGVAAGGTVLRDLGKADVVAIGQVLAMR
ncbi:hypothetical protein [Lentzea sp. NEAU-D7]|uniref:hypothetical protein n=1 Tax=Lentzea sp. NEAU-D7 TaxID=2994667 RepID=UPI00224B018C|nr:hypothetical protein [Lentzea sp. NEAU-D7]MCX2949687.1 hypothetical protein [Lentzea sp. NEAU-D7]